MKATSLGKLVPLDKCKVIIPGAGTITPRILPELSDGKGANYSDEPVMGRSFPLKTYSHSDNRAIGITFHFIAESSEQSGTNLKELRWIQSAVYPRDSVGDMPFVPPPVCTIQCGELFASGPLCAVLKNYSLKYPTNVPWDETTYLPWQFDVETSWDVVYKVNSLPGAEKIVETGGYVT